MPALMKPTMPLRYLKTFLARESAGGIIMVTAALLAIAWANSPWSAQYLQLTSLPVRLGLGKYGMEMPLKVFAKDVAMTLFFFVVGMELKREMREGFLSGKGQRLLPLLAAAGGITLPALAYIAFNGMEGPEAAGWAIPAATDIAFAICILSLAAGPNFPPSVKVFLLAVAIYDDLAAILIIALFYSGAIDVSGLMYAAMACGVLWALNAGRVSAAAPYIVVMAALLVFLHTAGVHGSIAGVLTGIAVPLRRHAEDSDSPLNHLMHVFHPWVAFGVLPFFALVSAGIDVRGMEPEALLAPVTLGVIAGLFLGKQLGVFGMTWLAVRLKVVAMPAGASWRQIYGAAVLTGVGFTMSLLIGGLAFLGNETLYTQAKLGVVAGSLLSAVWGAAILRLDAVRRQTPSP